MDNFIKLLKELKGTNSVVEKQLILERYKDDEQVKELLNYNLNPYLMFYIKKMPAEFDAVNHKLDPTWSTKNRYDCFIALLKDLNGRYTTGNLAKTTVEGVFKMFTKDEFDAYSKVLLKKPIGIGASTVNKVIPDFIPVFDVLKAPTELPNLAALKYPRGAQVKYDGFRAVYLPYDEDLIFGASGLPIKNKNVVPYFSSIQAVADYVLDAEIYSHEHTFEQIESILNSLDKPIPASFKFIVFDAIPVKDWQAKKCTLPYDDRLRIVQQLVQSVIGDRKKIPDVANEIVNNSGEAVDFYKKCLKDGYEGAMLRDMLGYYQWKRVTIKSGEILKVKPFKSIDVPIVGFYEGEGDNNTGTLGGIIVDIGNNLTCRVGSGFTRDFGEKIWQNQSEYLGKMVEIKYFENTEEGSLRHPRFERMRPDKDL